MAQAFESSCNVPFAEIGVALKADRMAGQAQAYGFCRTEPTFSTACQDETIPFVLPWEVGHFPDASYFENNEAALARSAIGLDNVLTNPLHLALIASRDRQRRHDVRAASRDRGPRHDHRPDDQDVRARRVRATHLTADSARQLRQMMVSVVESGTGTAAQIDGTVVAGKTGTAPTARTRRRTRGSPRSRRPARRDGAHRRSGYRAGRRRPRQRGDRRTGRGADREAGHGGVPRR